MRSWLISILMKQSKPAGLYPSFWIGKPYFSLDAYCKQTFGEKLYKIALDAGMNCPNRDGTLDTRGCIFCSSGGSGDFAPSRTLTIAQQLAAGRQLLSRKKTGVRFIAYFQAYTNTYAPVAVLKELFTQALSQPDIAGISIATRPDCLPAEVLSLLCELRLQFPDQFIWVELGLQTIWERTAAYIRRSYGLSVFDTAVSNLHSIDIPVIVHVILGLPGENVEQVHATIRHLNTMGVFGVKLQLLHILKDTDLYREFCSGRITVLSQEAYNRLLISCLEMLSPDIVIHRMTGDGPAPLLAAPLWSLDKRNVLNTIHKNMKEANTWQGKNYHDAGLLDTL